jgi:hypothetical protein
MWVCSNSEWQKVELFQYESGVCKLAFDNNGQQLGVTLQDGTVCLYKELGFCKWELIAMTNNEGVLLEQLNEVD